MVEKQLSKAVVCQTFVFEFLRNGQSLRKIIADRLVEISKTELKITVVSDEQGSFFDKLKRQFKD